jgi:Domain of unknown function (DUF1931)
MPRVCKRHCSLTPSMHGRFCTLKNRECSPLSLDVEAMLPDLVGTLAMLAGQTMKIIDPDVKNPDSEMWDRVLRLMELLL